MTIFQSPTGDLVEERKKRLKTLTKRAGREDILNCFTPNKVIDTPARFVGREEAIKLAISGLANSGTSLLIWGERGCGKSSLAFMVQQMASGHAELLQYYGLSDYLQKKGVLNAFLSNEQRRFNVIWVEATPEMSVAILAREILWRNADKIHGPGLHCYIERLPDEEELAGGIGVETPFKASVEGKVKFTTEKPSSPTEALRRAFERYAAENEEELLIVIDEFDTLTDRGLMAPLLKNSKNVRFILAGVSLTAVDLLSAHASIPRHVRSIALKPMERPELYAILEVGFHQLSRFFKVEASCITAIVDASDGSPFWCHLIARTIIEHHLDSFRTFSAFLEAAEELPLTTADVERAIASLPMHPDAELFEDTYTTCTWSDPVHENMLLHIAKRSERRYSTNVVKQSAAVELQIAPDEADRALRAMLHIDGGPFQCGRAVGDVYPFTFRDPNFRRYVVLRHRSKTRSPERSA